MPLRHSQCPTRGPLDALFDCGKDCPGSGAGGEEKSAGRDFLYQGALLCDEVIQLCLEGRPTEAACYGINETVDL